MPPTPDGFIHPLKPEMPGLAIAAAVVLAGVGIAALVSVCAGVPVLLIGLLLLVDRGGTRRIRVTHSKLLMEDERRIRGLLIGPIRNRVPWPEVTGVHVEADHVRVESAGGTTRVARGATAAEATDLAGKIERAIVAYAKHPE